MKTLVLNDEQLFILLDKEGIIVALPENKISFMGFRVGDSWGKMDPQLELSEGKDSSLIYRGINWNFKLRRLKGSEGDNIYYLVSLIHYKTDNEAIEVKLTDKFDASFYETILRHSNDDFLVTDNQGNVIFVSSAGGNCYGPNDKEMLDKTFWQLDKAGGQISDLIPLVLHKKKKIVTDKETIRGYRVLVSATPVFNDNGDIELVICNSKDVTYLEDMKNNLKDIKSRPVYRPKTEHIDSCYKLDRRLVYSDDSPFAELMKMLPRLAETEELILLQGETGTGKDLLAKQIHNYSNRRDENFIKVNCAALPGELIESELFGYSPGAFTGASSRGKAGQFTLANRGTIFLDEIAEIPIALQAKLLQVIEEKTYNPIGSKTSESVNVRIISATNKDLRKMVEENLFRADLYYRLCVISIEIPSLKERRIDIPMLIEYNLKILNQKHNRNVKLTQEAINCLVNYGWPGNIRELKHFIERLILTTNSEIVCLKDLPEYFLKGVKKKHMVGLHEQKLSLQLHLEATEREIILESYRRLKSSYDVAKELRISQSSATRKIRKYTELTIRSE